MPAINPSLPLVLRWSILSIAMVAALAGRATAQRDSAGSERVSFEGAPPNVRFTRQLSQVGDQVEQTVATELRMTTAQRRGAELVDKTQTTVEDRHRRAITTTDVTAGLTTGVKLRYFEVTKQLRHGDESSEPNASQAAVTQQPVAGKVYRCRRDGETLLVTDAQGGIPPMAEYEIVAQHMQTLGRANPLVNFLAGRTIYVGQKVSLPSEVAQRLLGLGNELGKVARFDLTLTGTTIQREAECAVFQADVEADSFDSSQMRMQLSGPLVVETGSCRPVRIELTGPVGMSETRGSYGNTYYLMGTGSMTVSLESLYRDAGR